MAATRQISTISVTYPSLFFFFACFTCTVTCTSLAPAARGNHNFFNAGSCCTVMLLLTLGCWSCCWARSKTVQNAGSQSSFPRRHDQSSYQSEQDGEDWYWFLGAVAGAV
jgi:hypothetical protein